MLFAKLNFNAESQAVTISQRMVELMKEEQFDKALEAFKNHEKFTPER